MSKRSALHVAQRDETQENGGHEVEGHNRSHAENGVQAAEPRNSELVATHLPQLRPGSRCTIDEHLPPEAIAYKLPDPHCCMDQSEDFGATCHALIEPLIAHRVLDNLRAAQSATELVRRLATARLKAACRRALTLDH